MTATNEERKKAARMIRQSGDKHPSTWQNIRDIAGMSKYFTLPEIRNRLADLIEPEPEQTFDEWLNGVKETCFANMECCDEPEWSLFSTINDAIRFYLFGKSGYGCRMIDYDAIDRNSCSVDYDTVHLDYVCSKCGEVFETGMYCSIDDNDNAVLKDFKYCPNCGRKVVKE